MLRFMYEDEGFSTREGNKMSKMTADKAASTLYIHDNGSVTCVKHAGYALSVKIERNPQSSKYSTERGTWVVAKAPDYLAFKDGTGYELECESCQTW